MDKLSENKRNKANSEREVCQKNRLSVEGTTEQTRSIHTYFADRVAKQLNLATIFSPFKE